MRTCREARSRILPAVDGSLPIESVFELEEHVRGCADCRARYEEALALEAAIARLPAPPVERIDLDRAVAGVREAIDREDEALGPRRRALWVPLGIASLAAAAVLVFLLRPTEPEPPTPTREPVARTEPPPARDLAPDPERAPPRPEAPLPETDPLDPSRLARARGEVRCILSLAAADLPPRGDRSPAASLARRVDGEARDLVREGWPLRRLVEGFVEDPDPLVARSALRYLGLRGDRLSLRTAGGALRNPGLAADAALALCDAGEAGLEGLERAVEDPRARPLVLARIAERGDERAARFLEQRVRDAARSRRDRGGSLRMMEALDALTATGPGAVPGILRLGSDGSLGTAEAVDAIARVPGAGAPLADAILSVPRGIDGSLVLRAVAAVQPPRALQLLRKRCLEERELRGETLAAIASFRGEEGIAALVEIAANGRVPREELAAPFREALAADRLAGAVVVEACSRAGRQVELRVFQGFLNDDPTADAAPAFITLGGSTLLPSSDRRWAVLLAGEVGRPEDADALARLFRSLSPAEREIRAACLIAIRSLGGIRLVEELLAPFPAHTFDRALALLEDRDALVRPATTLSRLARELENALAPLAP